MPMDPANALLHSTLIRLSKGAVKAWERWVLAKQKGLSPDTLQLHLALIRTARRGVLKPWEAWTNARGDSIAQNGGHETAAHLTARNGLANAGPTDELTD